MARSSSVAYDYGLESKSQKTLNKIALKSVLQRFEIKAGMNKTESNGRIRQVAIVLSSVDASTARQLLGQLPPAQARLVRQQMATLANVTPKERDAAMGMLAQLTGKSSQTTTHSARSVHSDSQRTSPAEALLSEVPSSLDRIEFTSGYSSRTEANSFSDSSSNSSYDARGNPVAFEEQFHNVQRQGENPFQTPLWLPPWQQWSGDELARLLSNERPTLIAAVLLQAPVELGSEILQALPSAIATTVLAVLPQLHTTDPSVLQEIYSQLHQRLSDFQRQTSPQNAGMTKLQAILATVSNEARKRFEQGLAVSEPLLAHALGVTNSKPTATATSQDTKGVEYRAVDSAHEPEDRAESLRETLPFPSKTYDEVAGSTRQESVFSFESLKTLSLEDLAIVLRSMDPNTILLAASGASRQMRERIEALVDPNEIKRLRARLQGLRTAKLTEKQSAQNKIAQAAHVLLQQGRIASLSNMTILAAA